MLDIHGCVSYYMVAREMGYPCAAHCDEAGDCASGGNFCRVCPVIGRLRVSLRGVYRRERNRPANVGLFSCHGVIRTVKRTEKTLDRTQRDKS